MTHHNEMHTRGPVIRTVGLTRHYTRNKQTIEAVRGLDLEIAPGELVAFLGPNGAGKSTTLRMLTTLIAPTAGTAEVAGFDVTRDRAAVRRSIGYVGQGNAAGHQYRGRDELISQARAHGLSRRDARTRTDELLEAFDLTEHADRPVSQLSGRPAAPAGRRDRAGAGAGDPLPRRAVDRARPAEPGEPAGAGAAAQRRARHHDRADDPLPRGGRRARGPRDRHRPRPDDRRRHGGRAEVRRSATWCPWSSAPPPTRMAGAAQRRPDPAARTSRSPTPPSTSARRSAGTRLPAWSPTSRPPGRPSPGWRSSGRRSTTSSSTSPAAACASPTRPPRPPQHEGEAA